jgi:hypothetical protein
MFADNYAKTPGELSAIPATGGAGGSGSSKVQVVTLLGNPAEPGPYSQLLRVAPGASIAAHHHGGIALRRCCQARGTSATERPSTPAN